MKSFVTVVAVLTFLTCWSYAGTIQENPFSYDPYANFGGMSGVHSIASPNTYTLSTYDPNPTWHFMPETVTFMVDGSGSCQPGSCTGVSNHVWETFSTLSYAMYWRNTPNLVTTTATYYLNGSVVDVTTQIGGPVWRQRAPGFKFNEVELSWATPTNYAFSFESFDAAAPEPSSLILLVSGAVALAGLFRRKFMQEPPYVP